MILYHAVSVYQLIESILHRKKISTKESADIIISTDITFRYPNYTEILKFYFNKIIVYNNSEGSKIAIEGSRPISHYFNLLLKNNNTDIKQYSEIYVGCCHAAFGVYLSFNNIPYIFMEDAAGALSHTKGLEEHVEKNSPKRHQLLKEMGLYNGESKLVKKRLLNFSAQGPGFIFKENDINFDVEEVLASLDPSLRQSIISQFTSYKQISIPQNGCLLLTEHLANLKILSYNEQVLMYQLIVDYFLLNYSLVIKPHPDDIVPYKKYFPNCFIIKEKFPSEFLPFMFSNRPCLIATVSSTAIWGMRNSFQNVLEFNQDFSYYYKQFYGLSCYYAALKWASPLFKDGTSCALLGSNYTIINNFFKFSSDLEIPSNIFFLNSISDLSEIREKQVIIIDLEISDYSETEYLWSLLEDICNEVYVIFINSNSKYLFFNHKYKYLWDQISPLEISVTANRDNENLFYPIEAKYIYIYKKGERHFMKPEKKELPNTGVTLSMNEFSGNELRIKVLEGIVRSLEERLLYYINKEKEDATNKYN